MPISPILSELTYYVSSGSLSILFTRSLIYSTVSIHFNTVAVLGSILDTSI